MAGAVWWSYTRLLPGTASSSTCPPPAEGPIPPAQVLVNVYNATDRAGFATAVASQLRERGFRIGDVANDPTDREVTGRGEIRYGPEGTRYTYTLGAHSPGNTGVPFADRAGSDIDLVLGPRFAGLRSPEAAASALGLDGATPVPSPTC